MRRIAVIGLGLLGGAVASRLLQGRFEVAGHDVRPEQAEALRPQGLRPAASLGEAIAGADAVFTVLPTLATVQAVYLDPGGLVASVPRSATLIQMSTISQTLTLRLAEAARARGLAFLDTPMSGTSSMVARGDCTIFVGGEAAHVEACRPVFDAVARKTLHVGPVGTATVAKLATNMLVGLNTAALAEALVLGTKGGLHPAALVEIFRDSAAGSRMVEVRGPLMAERRFAAQMKLELFLKDFTLMLEEGQHLGVSLPLTSLAHQLCTAAVAAGHGGEDLAAVMKTLERLAGLDA